MLLFVLKNYVLRNIFEWSKKILNLIVREKIWKLFFKWKFFFFFFLFCGLTEWYISRESFEDCLDEQTFILLFIHWTVFQQQGAEKNQRISFFQKFRYYFVNIRHQDLYLQNSFQSVFFNNLLLNFNYKLKLKKYFFFFIFYDQQDCWWCWWRANHFLLPPLLLLLLMFE